MQPLRRNIEHAQALIQSKQFLHPKHKSFVLKFLISSKLVLHFANDLVDNNALDNKRFVPVMMFANLNNVF